MDDPIVTVGRRLAAARFAVAFTGAGISTESGIPDFRSPGGLWTRFRVVEFDEFLASPRARADDWRMNKAAFEEFAGAGPNRGHEILARWERAGRIAGVITQNIDGLHQAAGSRNVLELHGTARFVACLSCRRRWPSEEIFRRYGGGDDVPVCDECGGWLKPATVSFGQDLPGDVLERAEQWTRQADFFLAIGSSLVVQPAAMLPVLARRAGAFLVIVNRDATPCDRLAHVALQRPIGETLAAIDEVIV